MKISVDGGGICTQFGYGNYIFSVNLLRALSDYDNDNKYQVYTFCEPPAVLKNTTNFWYDKILPVKGWMKFRVTIEERFYNNDIFLALNQSLPYYSSSRLISFSHGLSFLHFPQLYKDNYRRLKSQLDEYCRRSEKIIVSSEKVKKELEDYNISINSKIRVLPFGIPYEFQTTQTQKKEKYFLYVGMNHPVKNIKFIVDIFKKLCARGPYKDYSLYLVSTCKEFQSAKINIIPSLSRSDLVRLYQKATAYLSASHYESFNFPVLEALSQRCPVVAMASSVTPEMRQYVNIANDEEEFFIRLQRVCEGSYKKYDLDGIRTFFSWKQYVLNLRNMYN